MERKEAAVVNACCCFFGQGDAILHLLLPTSALPFASGVVVDARLFPITVGVENLSKR